MGVAGALTVYALTVYAANLGLSCWQMCHVGKRDLQSAQQLWEKVPAPWHQSLVFTDGYPVYQALLAQTPLRHCRCLKSDKTSRGETSVIEEVYNALRQGVSYLGRKSLAFARSLHWLQVRLHWFIHQWNLRQAKKYD